MEKRYEEFDIWNTEFDEEDYEQEIQDDISINHDWWKDRGYFEASDSEKRSMESACAYELHESDLDLVCSDSCHEIANGILVICRTETPAAGVRNGYRLIGNELSSIFRSGEGISDDGDDVHWYCDGSDIVCDEIHRDRNCHYTYREIEDSRGLSSLLNRIAGQEDFSRELELLTETLVCYFL